MAVPVPAPILEVASGNWIRNSFVDPSDPTHIYTSQPYTPTAVHILLFNFRL